MRNSNITKKTMFADGCELRIGKRKLNITNKNDLFFGQKYQYGFVSHWHDKNNKTTGWIWDYDWVAPLSSLNQVKEWNEHLQLALTKPVLNLDKLKSSYEILSAD